MNEETLNNTTTVRGDKHCGGFVLLESVVERRWRACEWSAFFVHLMMPGDRHKSYMDSTGRAIVELTDHNIRVLGDRLVPSEEQLPGHMLFVVPENLAISQVVYDRWKNSLTSELKSPSHELQSPFHG